MKVSDVPIKYYNIRNNNYLTNAYNHLIKSKFVHSIFLLIEIFLNIFQELNIYLYRQNLNSNSNKAFLFLIIVLQNKIRDYSSFKKMIILVLYSIIFDILYLFLKKLKLKKSNTCFYLLFNLLEFFHFRIFVIVSLNIFFSLHNSYLYVLLIFFILHIYLIKNHFSYNHLYYFVPIFIEYPYDEFTSLYDSILLCIKIFLSIIINIDNPSLKKYISILFLVIQIIFCIYFVNLLLNHSYLFMKNYLLNISKVSLFFTQTFTLIIAESVGNKELLNFWLLVIEFGLLIIFLLLILLLYEPKSYIKIGAKTPMENLFYYFHIISEESDLNFLIETKINEHYQNCNVCELCKKFKKYLIACSNDNTTENEKFTIINLHKFNEENNPLDLFQILYENQNNYFKLINELVLYYKNDKAKFLINSSYYYINLSFLIYSELKNDNTTLSLNIKLLLEVMNLENKYIENQESKIHQIMFCNNFLSLSKNILKQLKIISTGDYTEIKKYIDLSVSLKEMQSSKYKNVLYNYKHDNHSNSNSIIMICSILYEEIFNLTINTSQPPIRNNYQVLDDIFFNNTNKIDKIITLSINLTNNDCKIIRAGKSLYKYKDKSLFDLFPLIFKDYQVKYFLSKILGSFNIDSKGIKKIDSLEIESIIKRETKKFKREQRINIKSQGDYLETKLIICEDISTKLFYKLLILKLTPLFNCDFNNYYLLFDGQFYLYKNTIMTFQNFEKSRNIEQKVFSVSKPELERPPEIYSMKYQKYSLWLEKNGFLLSKIFEYKFSKKTYSIYALEQKEIQTPKKKSRLSFYQRESIGEVDFLEEKNGINLKNKFGNLVEENESVMSQLTANNYQFNITGLGIKNKKKQNIYRYSSLYKIKNTLMFSIPIIFLTFLIETIHLNQLKNENINNDYSIVKFDEIYKIYFQLFSSTLNIACLKVKDDCISIANNYKKNYERFNYFNFSMFLTAQSKLLAQELLSKKNNLINIHKNIGNEKYKEIFEEKIDYLRIGKTVVNGNLILSLTNISIPFSEAILILCNSFQIIVNNTKNEPIYILNKKTNPFFYLFQDEIYNFSDYQKEISEMILNYKVYKDQFMIINQKFIDTLAIQSQKIELYIYLYFSMTLLICIYILSLLFVYIIQFEQMIIKILNYVNMVKNFKDEKYNFSLIFLQKIENLEIILKIYIDNPIKAIQDLNSLYHKYHKLMLNQDKNNKSHINARDNKKIIEEANKKSELDMIPLHLRFFKTYDIRKVNVIYYYFVFFIFICLCVVIIYIYILYLWINYSKVKTNLYSLIVKNLELEVSLYKAINLYDLLIFNNLTLEELATDTFYAPEKNIYNRETLLNSFYEDLFISFNYEVELNILKNNFRNFPLFIFSCENLYDLNREYIYELADYSSFKNISDVERILFDICKFSRLDEYNEMSAVFQKHFQEIKNSVVSIVDNSYEGLVNHLNEGKFGEIVINFNCISIYLLNIISNRMHKIEIEGLILILKENLAITLAVSFFSYVILIILVRWYFIWKFKIYFNQILLLKKVFKVNEIQEQ